MNNRIAKTMRWCFFLYFPPLHDDDLNLNSSSKIICTTCWHNSDSIVSFNSEDRFFLSSRLMKTQTQTKRFWTHRNDFWIKDETHRYTWERKNCAILCVRFFFFLFSGFHSMVNNWNNDNMLLFNIGIWCLLFVRFVSIAARDMHIECHYHWTIQSKSHSIWVFWQTLK